MPRNNRTGKFGRRAQASRGPPGIPSQMRGAKRGRHRTRKLNLPPDLREKLKQ